MGDRVLTSGGSPFGPGRQSRTAQAQLATGLGDPASSTRHMRQLPAIESLSWYQKRGISAPAASHAWSSVYSGGTSTSLPSMMILVMPQTHRARNAPSSTTAPTPSPNRRRGRLDRAASDDRGAQRPPRHSAGGPRKPTTLRNRVPRSARTIRRGGHRIACAASD